MLYNYFRASTTKTLETTNVQTFILDLMFPLYTQIYLLIHVYIISMYVHMYYVI